MNTVSLYLSMVGREDLMLKLVAQRGPLGINVDAILWHDYMGMYVREPMSLLSLYFSFMIQLKPAQENPNYKNLEAEI